MIDSLVEILAETTVVNTHSRTGQTRDLIASDEGAATGPYWAKLGYGFAVACHDEGFAGRHGVDHLGIVVTKFALGDFPGHNSEL